MPSPSALAFSGSSCSGTGETKRTNGEVAEPRARRDGPKERCEEGGRESGGRRERPFQRRRWLVEESQARREPSGEKESEVTEGMDGVEEVIVGQLGALEWRESGRGGFYGRGVLAEGKVALLLGGLLDGVFDEGGEQ